MTLVDWEAILSDHASVTFSSLSYDRQPNRLDRDIAQIRLEGGYIIDIKWDGTRQEYMVSLYKGDFENPENEVVSKTPGDVIDTVKGWDDHFSRSPGLFSASTSRPVIFEPVQYEYA